MSVEISIVLRDVDVDLSAGLGVRRGQLFGLVITFRTPSYVVGVTEGIDVQDVDVCGSEKDVLDELRGLGDVRF